MLTEWLEVLAGLASSLSTRVFLSVILERLTEYLTKMPSMQNGRKQYNIIT